MRAGLLANLVIAVTATGAFATEFDCKTASICKCPSEDGCSGLAKFIDDLPKEKCALLTETFEIALDGEHMQVYGPEFRFLMKEARPYFSDLDWYQSGATAHRGLVNLSFDDESATPSFEFREMVVGSVNEHIWRMTGTCRVRS